jgi:hypothetical protein
MADMMSADQLRSALPHFHGTQQWHRYSPLFRQALLTDGVLFLCENAGAYWLADAICSHIFTDRKKFSPQANPMQFWKLTVKDSKATLTCRDGGKLGAPSIVLARQEIEYSDFPLDEIEVLASWDGGMNAYVLMLKSEY